MFVLRNVIYLMTLEDISVDSKRATVYLLDSNHTFVWLQDISHVPINETGKTMVTKWGIINDFPDYTHLYTLSDEGFYSLPFYQ